MRFRAKPTAFAILALVAIAMLAASETPQAATAAADVVLVREGEIVEEDLYATGNVVTIDGEIDGDLVFWAFDRIDIRGTVNGDVVGFAPTARITGNVGGSVRIVGIDVSAAGEIGADVFVAAWKATTGGSVGRDVLAWSRSLNITGTVGRNVEGQTWGPTVISGAVGQDVEMTVQSMTLVGDAYVAQDLGFRSRAEATIGPDAGVGGTVIRRAPVAPNVSVSAARMVAFVLGFLGFLWLGILTIWLAPSTVGRAVHSVSGDLSRSFFVGLVAIVTPIILIGAIFLIAALAPPELAFTILAVGTPFWLGLIVVLMLSALIAPVPVLIVVGARISKGRWSAFASFVLLSLPLAIIVVFIPYIRGVVSLAVITVGIGALARGAIRSRGSLTWAAGLLKSPRPKPAPHDETPDDDEDEDQPGLYAVEGHTDED